MRIDYGYNRKNLSIIPEKGDREAIWDIKTEGKWERVCESIFIEKMLAPLGLQEVKEFNQSFKDLFPGPLIYDVVSGDAYYFDEWAQCNFIDRLLNNQPIIWDKV